MGFFFFPESIQSIRTVCCVAFSCHVSSCPSIYSFAFLCPSFFCHHLSNQMNSVFLDLVTFLKIGEFLCFFPDVPSLLDLDCILLSEAAQKGCVLGHVRRDKMLYQYVWFLIKLATILLAFIIYFLTLFFFIFIFSFSQLTPWLYFCFCISWHSVLRALPSCLLIYVGMNSEVLIQRLILQYS